MIPTGIALFSLHPNSSMYSSTSGYCLVSPSDKNAPDAHRCHILPLEPLICDYQQRRIQNFLEGMPNGNRGESGADPGFGQGGPQLLRLKVADVAKRSHTSKASNLRPGSRACLRALEALGF